MSSPQTTLHTVRTVHIPAGLLKLEGVLKIPDAACGIVLFAEGDAGGRRSPPDQSLAHSIGDCGVATLLLDLLTPRERASGAALEQLRAEAEVLAARLARATDWLGRDPGTRDLTIGYFGAGRGAAAALLAAAERGEGVGAVVSRGGQPNLAFGELAAVTAPTLLLVGERDEPALAANRDAYDRLSCEKELVLVPGATHLFDEPGAVEEAARHATRWFQRHLRRERRGGEP